MKVIVNISFAVYLFLLSCESDKTVTEPEPPEPPQKRMVTFEGRAFLDGQPDPVNALHLPLHYDIQIVSYLPGDSTSYDTVYTDSNGVYSSTKLRYDGTYFILSQYPYYTIDTIEVKVQNGQVVGAIPELHSKRLLKIEIFADSTVYHSLQSQMFFDEFTTNLNCDSTIWVYPCDSLVSRAPGAVSAPTDYSHFLAPKDSIFNLFFASTPNITFNGCLPVCQTLKTYVRRLLINFGDPATQIRPGTGTYYLYLKGQPWSAYGAWFPHYKKSIHWWFKVSEPTIIEVKLE